MIRPASSPPADRSRGLQNVLRSLGLTTASMVIGLLLLELVVRVDRAARGDAVLLYVVRFRAASQVHPGRSGDGTKQRSSMSNTGSTHWDFARGRSARKKLPGTRRILMLGDSFTEGDGVEYGETFSARLQAMLDSTVLPERWEVINAGVGSYAPLVEYLYLTNCRTCTRTGYRCAEPRPF